MTRYPRWLVFFVVFLMIGTAGCGGSRVEKSAQLTDDDLAILAGLAEDTTTAQTAVEIISIPSQSDEFISDEAYKEPTPEDIMVKAVVELEDEELAKFTADETLAFEKKVQVALKRAHYYEGKIDGKVGPMTRKAIRSFQEDQGLKADGIAGPRTWAKLKSHFYLDEVEVLE